MKIKILGTGFYVPEQVITNDDLSQIMDTSNEWILSRTGISNRHFATTEGTTDLAIQAAKKAMENATASPAEIDLVICATMTADHFTPSLACEILAPLGISKAMAFDVNAACSGFVYALHVASSMLNSNTFRKALIVGAEKISKLLDYTDRNTAVLFGDGAGAIVLEKGNHNVSFYSKAKSDVQQSLYASSLNKKTIFTNQYEAENFYLKMNGQEVFKFALEALTEGITKQLEIQKLTIEEIDLIIPHQANIRIIQSVAKKLSIPIEKFFINLDQYGNTSAASIAIALAEAEQKKRIKENMKIIFVGFGAGLTWSSMFYDKGEK